MRTMARVAEIWEGDLPRETVKETKRETERERERGKEKRDEERKKGRINGSSSGWGRPFEGGDELVKIESSPCQDSEQSRKKGILS